MDRRGFFASVLALPLLVTQKRSDFCHTAPVKRFAPGAPAVFSGDWNIHGARWDAATYAMTIPIDPKLCTWVVPTWRENF